MQNKPILRKLPPISFRGFSASGGINTGRNGNMNTGGGTYWTSSAMYLTQTSYADQSKKKAIMAHGMLSRMEPASDRRDAAPITSY